MKREKLIYLNILSKKVSADIIDALISYPCVEEKLQLVQKIHDEYPCFKQLPTP